MEACSRLFSPSAALPKENKVLTSRNIELEMLEEQENRCLGCIALIFLFTKLFMTFKTISDIPKCTGTLHEDK